MLIDGAKQEIMGKIINMAGSLEKNSTKNAEAFS